MGRILGSAAVAATVWLAAFAAPAIADAPSADTDLAAPSAIDFGVMGPYETYRLSFNSIVNNGDTVVPITGLAILGQDAGSFPLVQDGCSGQELATGGTGSCGFIVEFAPESAGSRSAILEVHGESTDPLLQIPLTGSKQALPPLPAFPVGTAPSPSRHCKKKHRKLKHGKCVKKKKKKKRGGG
jgi:hypothetical protein